jgi:hypothetical protein
MSRLERPDQPHADPYRHDKQPDLDEYNDENDVDDETAGHLQREACPSQSSVSLALVLTMVQIDKAEADDKYPEGKPGSFLNRLISHGNKKTEEQIAREQALSDQNKK